MILELNKLHSDEKISYDSKLGVSAIRLNSLKLLETEVQNPKSGFEAVKCIPPPPGVPPSLLKLGN